MSEAIKTGLDVNWQELPREDIQEEAAANAGKMINWNSWLNLPFWQPQEAASLLHLLEPGRTHPYLDKRKEIEEKAVLAVREHAAKMLPAQTTPTAWVEWAKNKGWHIHSQFNELTKTTPQDQYLSTSAGKKGSRLIEIPAGSGILNVAEILQKVIKQASPPLPPRGLSVVSLQKRFTLESKSYKDEDLTDDDCDLLESIKCDSPIADWFPMTQAQFEELKALFESAPNKPEWGLSASSRDYYSEAKAAHNMSFNAHLDRLSKLVKEGRVNLIAESGEPIRISPTQGIGLNAFFTIEEAHDYLKQSGFQLVETDNEQAEPQQFTPQDGTATLGKFLAGVGTAVLYVKVAELEAAKYLQNSPIANDLLKRHATLQQAGKSNAPNAAMLDIKATAPKPKILQVEKAPSEREHELHNLIYRTFESLNYPSKNNAVWKALGNPENDTDGIIQEIKNDVIFWMSWRGREQKMARKTFNNYLWKLRNI